MGQRKLLFLFYASRNSVRSWILLILHSRCLFAPWYFVSSHAPWMEYLLPSKPNPLSVHMRWISADSELISLLPLSPPGQFFLATNHFSQGFIAFPYSIRMRTLMPLSKIPHNALSYSLPPPYHKLRSIASMRPLYILEIHFVISPLCFSCWPSLQSATSSITLRTLPMFQSSSYFTSSKKPLYIHPVEIKTSVLHTPLGHCQYFSHCTYQSSCSIMSIYIVSLIEEWEIILWTRGHALSSLIYLQFFSQCLINSKHSVPACWSEWN